MKIKEICSRVVVVAEPQTDLREAARLMRDLMSSELALAQETDGVFEAVDKMQDSGTRRLPVVDAEGRLVGILSLDDVLRMLASELTALALASQRSIAREASARPPLAGRAA